MFADDFDRKGVAGSFTVSITIHLLVLMLFLFYQYKQRIALKDYTLTEITMIEELPEEAKPMRIEKPKKMFDILKQIIPIKQKQQLSVSKPQELKLDKPKAKLEAPKALSLDKSKLDKLKPNMKAIDLDNEIGKKAISPAMMKQQLELQKQQKLASAPSTKLDMSSSKKSSILPSMGKPAISTGSTRRTSGLKQSSFKLGKPTPEPKRDTSSSDGNIVIDRKPLLITGEIAGREILVAKKPIYPRWAQQQGLEAAVTIFFTVRPDGSVKENAVIERSSGNTELDDLAKDALLQFKFARIDGFEDQSGYATFRYMLER